VRGGWLMRALFVGLLVLIVAGLVALTAIGAWHL
jgi:hypothetical protein